MPQSKLEHQFGINENDDLEFLLEKCREQIPNCDETIVRLAYNYCIIAHEGKLRKSGNKFYTHPLSVAFIVLQEIPLDNDSVVAALLHNVLDESDIYSYEDIKFTFGSNVAQIVEGISRIRYVEKQHIDRPDQKDNYRKLLLTLFTDIRIILIKLADRLDNLRTLQYVTAESQVKIAQETLDIYAPFANRFGLTRIKFEFEDLSFKYLHPEKYKKIECIIKGTHKERSEYVERFKEPVIRLLEAEGLLKKENVSYRINGRAKNIYSIYNKTLLRQKKVEELYDIFAIRIILDTDNPFLCFYVYGIVANYYKPLPDTFKDYISNPKENGYSSLHTAVLGLDDRAVEVQIRTEQMHHASEIGVAAHFRYKSSVTNSILEDSIIQHWLDDVRDIFDKVGTEDSSKLYGIISNNMLLDKIYVFTPKEEFKQLPKGSTALDFAFDIHSEVGMSCIGAKVNGKFCPINYVLNSGDKVEIITSKNQVPTKEWLDFVFTTKAHSKLLKYFKDERNFVIAKGKAKFEKQNTSYGFDFSAKILEHFIKIANFDNIDDLFEAIGNNTIDLEKVYQVWLSRITNITESISTTEAENKKNINQLISAGSFTDVLLSKKLSHIDDYKFVTLDCCNPLPGDSIFGIQEYSNTISVHNSICPKYKKLLQTHPNDIIILDWDFLPLDIFQAKLKIISEDKEDLIQNIINAITCDNQNQMLSCFYEVDNFIFEGIFGFRISNNTYISDIIASIEQFDGVQTIERLL
jgi:RelA/SpoT family (p)ppGpp synthetase